LEEVSKENHIEQTNFKENESEFLPPPNFQIKSNPITQENSSKAKIILNETLIKNDISLDLKPVDRHIGFPVDTPVFFRRWLEMIPGVLTWALVFIPVIGIIFSLTSILVGYFTILVIYWLYVSSRFVYGLWIGVKRTKRDLNIDWISKVKKEYPKEYNELKYVLIYPIHSEGLKTIEPSVAGWANSDVDTGKISLVVAIEEKHAQKCIENFEYIKEKYGNHFREIVYYIHPANIEGEVNGVKGANINWATRNFVNKVHKRCEDTHNYLLFTFDCDQIPHRKYMSAITYKYLNSTNQYHQFFSSAVHTFNNNIWRVPISVRAYSSSLTLTVLHGWTVMKNSKDTWSSYAVNLKTVDEVNYWCPDIENDDTAFYWNAKIRFNGDFTGEEVYIPTYNDAVENENYVKNHQSLYDQQYRWGWGIIVFPITLAGLFYNQEISFKKRLGILWSLLDNQVLLLNVVYLIIGIPIVSFFYTNFTQLQSLLPYLLVYISLGATLLYIPIIFLRRQLIPIPSGWTSWRHIRDILETLYISVNMITFGFVPYLHAQTMLLIGLKPKNGLNNTKK
jgi:hypothetical protein